MYIGRVGALAVALGIGAAVATAPGIAFADDGEPSSADTGANPALAEPSNLDPQPTDLGGGAATEGEGAGAGGEATAPPTMNVSANTVDTSTNDDDANIPVVTSEDDEGEGAENGNLEFNDPIPESLEVGHDAEGNGSQADNSGHSTLQQIAKGWQPQTNSIDGEIDDDAESKSSLRSVVEQADNSSGTLSFTFSAVDDSSDEARALNTAAASVAAVPADPIAALISFPVKIFNSVLSSILGGPNPPPGENPILIGLLAFVRRQFAPFQRTFTNDAPIFTGAQVDENADGSFTITVDTEAPDVDASDPEGDTLTFGASGGVEGSLVKTGATTFRYTPGEYFDGADTVTLTATDPGGLFGFNRKSTSFTIDIEAANDDDPTQPEDPEPPVQNEDGSVDTELRFDPTKVASVTVAPGFEPKYYTYTETYNEQTGEYELQLTPTQAGMLRAALGLDTADSVGLQVTTNQTQTVQTFVLRSASFAALAAPDYTVELPDIPAGRFVTRDAIVTSPSAANPAGLYPAGTVLTDRYAYVVNSRAQSGGATTVSVIGADPDRADYLQVIDEIDIDGTALLVTKSGDRLYLTANNSVQVIDIDGSDTTDEADDNTLLAPIALDRNGAVVPVASPDGKKLYVINQGQRTVSVIDTDRNSATFHTVLDEIVVADPPTVVDNGDGTSTVSGMFPLSAAFNVDGSRMYLVRDGQTYTQTRSPSAITDFRYSGEIIAIDTATNEIIGDPLPLQGDYGYFASSDGKFLYVPALTMNGFDPTSGTDISPITGSVNVIDVRNPDNPVIVANLSTGNLPVNVVFSPDKSLAYVVDAGSGTVFIIDTVNQEVLDLDPVAAGDQGLVFDADPSAALGQVFNVVAASPDGTRLFVTNFGKGTVVPLEFVRDA